ncbi:MAG: hypothetical protein IKE16_03350 [Solobacterium sp.]|nr:hypothetical protein [Solobacterium sp.]
MTKMDAKTNKAEASMLSADELNTVSGGTMKEEDYVVTSEKVCPYCGSTQVYPGSTQRNFGFTQVWREYKCRKCGKYFWHEYFC